MQGEISENTKRMLYGKKTWLQMLLLSLPILINNLIKSFNGMVDIYFVSRMEGSSETISSAIAALNLHETFNNLILALGVGLSIGAMAVVSQFIGAKRYDKAKYFSGQFIALSVIVGIVLTIFILVTSWLIIPLMGAKGQTFEFAFSYFNIRSFELVGVVFFTVYQAIRQSQGSTVLPTIYNVLGILLNIVLTWYFVSVLKMGVMGSAWATLIGNMIFVPFMLLDLYRSKKYIKLKTKDLLPRKESIKELWPFAYPAALSHAITYFGFFIINVFVQRVYGDDISSAFATGNKLSSLLMNPIYAITTISAVFIGANIGHGKPERARKIYNESGVMTFSITVVAITIAIIYRKPFVEALVGPGNPYLVKVSIEYTIWLLLTQPAMAIFQNYMAIFNGSGNSDLGMKAQSFRLWVLRIPMLIILFIFFKNLSYSIVWIAMNVSNILALFHAHHLTKRVSLEVKVNIEDGGQTA
ncbi:MATE family efflux transporter [Acholeplasma hippikon]|nr:MATE family efflux transporter [Acholeplasma hippikon]